MRANALVFSGLAVIVAGRFHLELSQLAGLLANFLAKTLEFSGMRAIVLGSAFLLVARAALFALALLLFLLLRLCST